MSALIDDLILVAWQVFNHDNPWDDADGRWNRKELQRGFEKALRKHRLGLKPASKILWPETVKISARRAPGEKHRCRYEDADPSLPFNGGLNPKVCRCGKRKIWAGCKWTYRPAIKPASPVETLVRITAKNRRYIKTLRKLGASNYEISKAIGIPEDSLLLHEG